MIKRTCLLLFALLLAPLLVGTNFVLAQQGDPGPPPMMQKAEGDMKTVQTVLDQFGRMWEDEDMTTFERIIAHDADMVIIGTDTAEYIVGYDAYKKARQQQYDSFDNVEFYVQDRDVKISESGDVAWFSERFDLFTIAEGTPVNLQNLRLSGVLEKRKNGWRIVQLHTSVPVAGQAAEY